MEQLFLDFEQLEPLPAEPCMWLDEWYDHEYCGLWQTFRVDCIECMKRGREQRRIWREEGYKYA